MSDADTSAALPAAGTSPAAAEPANNIIGRFQMFRAPVPSPCLVQYIDATKSARGRVFLFAEGVRTPAAASAKSLAHIAVERLVESMDPSDVWALGTILLELFLGRSVFQDDAARESILDAARNPAQNLSVRSRVLASKLSGGNEDEEDEARSRDDFADFIQTCLAWYDGPVATVHDLRRHRFLTNCTPVKPLRHQLAVAHHEWTKYFHFWRMGGVDLEGVLRKRDLPQAFAIDRLPAFVRVDDDPSELVHDLGGEGPLFSDGPFEVLLPNRPDVESSARLSLSVLEKDVSYQSERIQAFLPLLKEFPLSVNEIVQEATKDIPPVRLL
ncbi:hypothetical protein HK405_008594 [Cladochytrium tenue]|nr:hypothetical protein HK405_008594 [Cladochytrium tenue]